jgi:integrase
MGQHLRRPPKFTHGYIDRHGKPRFYFRRTGFKNMPLPGLPWSPEFMAKYEEALTATPPPEIGAKRTKPGSLRAEIRQFEDKYPIGSKPRLALALGLFTGQARQDVVRMGPQHIQDEVLSWVRGKTERTTGIELAIPVHPTLRSIIDATRSGHLTFLVTEFGKPFTAAGFGNWFREQCDIANLHHCSFHGLRKATSVRLAESGCTTHEIAAITGHASLTEIDRYTKTAERKRLARSAIAKVKTRTFSG